MKKIFIQSYRLNSNKIYRGLFVALLSMFFFTNLKAADYTVEQWRVVEISLTSSVSYTDPFNDVEVTATFTGPGGITIVRPAYWDGGTSWQIRFAPTLTGNWTMTTACTITSNTGLHNISKTIQCNAYSGSYDIYKHGFLKADASGRYFVYSDGTPFFYLGDTHWLYTHERNSVLGGGSHTGKDEEPHCNFRDGFDEKDIPGFRNIDRKFKYIADKGLVHANSSICWALDPAEFPESYSEAYMYKLGKYWAARYGAYPVLWTVAQEIDKNMYKKYDSITINKWFAVGKALYENDGYHHPLTAHMENVSSTRAVDSWWRDKTYHSWWSVQWQEDLNYYKAFRDV